MNNINVGDKVSFNTRYKYFEGVVTRLRTKKSRKLGAFLSHHGISNGTQVAEVSTNSNGKEQLWTVATRSLTKIGTASREEKSKSIEKAADIKQSYSNAMAERRCKRANDALANGLHNCRHGDAIEIKTRQGDWIKCTFVKFNTTGNIIAIDEFQRQWKASPSYVRIDEQLK